MQKCIFRFVVIVFLQHQKQTFTPVSALFADDKCTKLKYI